MRVRSRGRNAGHDKVHLSTKTATGQSDSVTSVEWDISLRRVR